MTATSTITALTAAVRARDIAAAVVAEHYTHRASADLSRAAVHGLSASLQAGRRLATTPEYLWDAARAVLDADTEPQPAAPAAEVTEVIVTAHEVPEEQWEPLREALDCLPGDLGRWKGGRNVMLDMARFSHASVEAVTVFLASRGIAHEVETTTVLRHDPSAPVVPVQVPRAGAAPAQGVTLTAQQLAVVLDALDDAVDYRDASEQCVDCDAAAVAADDDDVTCEDHTSDANTAREYVSLSVLLRERQRLAEHAADAALAAPVTVVEGTPRTGATNRPGLDLSHPVTEAVHNLGNVWARTRVSNDVAERFSCAEVDALVQPLALAGHADEAASWLVDHADSDVDEDDSHHAISAAGGYDDRTRAAREYLVDLLG